MNYSKVHSSGTSIVMKPPYSKWLLCRSHVFFFCSKPANVANMHAIASLVITVRVNVDRPAGSGRAKGRNVQTELSTEVTTLRFMSRRVVEPSSCLIAPVLCH
jgi:hypothetical protein